MKTVIMHTNADKPMRSEILAVPARRVLVQRALFPLIAVGTAAVIAFALACLSHQAAPAQVTIHISHASPAPVAPAPAPGVSAPAPAPAPVPVAAPASAPAAPAPVAEPGPTGPTPRSAEHALVFELGGRTFAAIDLVAAAGYAYDDVDRPPLPSHGPLTYVGTEDYAEGVYAALDRGRLPADVRAWLGKSVLIDNACQAEVEDLALVALISGSFDYFVDGSEAADEARRAELVLTHGTAYLAAELSGCRVDSGIARLASLPLAISARLVNDPDLAARARERLLSSPSAEAAQRAYAESEQEGLFYRAEYAEIDSRVYRHPKTGQVVVSVTVVVVEGCGGANIGLWAVYRADESGELTEIAVHDNALVTSVGQPVDVDGDGRLEFPAHDWSGDRLLVALDGAILDRLEVPFYGCPC